LATAGHVALVGHEPHISAWLSLLVAGHSDALHCQFKKAGVACVEVDRVPPAPGSGTLRWFLTPKQLRQIGDPA
jgi:phosphohistidine phosphatase SixA